MSAPIPKPSAAPVNIAATIARNGSNPACTTTAKASEANPKTAGKDRSISPAVTTNTSGAVMNSATGSVVITDT